MLFKYSCEEGIVHVLYRGKASLGSILTQIYSTETQLLLCYFIDLHLLPTIICFQTTVSDGDQNSYPNIWLLQSTTSKNVLYILCETSNPSLRGDNVFLTVPFQWDRIMDFFFFAAFFFFFARQKKWLVQCEGKNNPKLKCLISGVF